MRPALPQGAIIRHAWASWTVDEISDTGNETVTVAAAPTPPRQP